MSFNISSQLTKDEVDKRQKVTINQDCLQVWSISDGSDRVGSGRWGSTMSSCHSNAVLGCSSGFGWGTARATYVFSEWHSFLFFLVQSCEQMFDFYRAQLTGLKTQHAKCTECGTARVPAGTSRKLSTFKLHGKGPWHRQWQVARVERLEPNISHLLREPYSPIYTVNCDRPGTGYAEVFIRFKCLE
jgi:hypothetical protein